MLNIPWKPTPLSCKGFSASAGTGPCQSPSAPKPNQRFSASYFEPMGFRQVHSALESKDGLGSTVLTLGCRLGMEQLCRALLTTVNPEARASGRGSVDRKDAVGGGSKEAPIGWRLKKLLFFIFCFKGTCPGA